MEPLKTNLPKILIVELGRTTEMFLAWFNSFKLNGSTCIGTVLFPVKAGFLRLYIYYTYKKNFDLNLISNRVFLFCLSNKVRTVVDTDSTCFKQ